MSFILKFIHERISTICISMIYGYQKKKKNNIEQAQVPKTIGIMLKFLSKSKYLR